MQRIGTTHPRLSLTMVLAAEIATLAVLGWVATQGWFPTTPTTLSPEDTVLTLAWIGCAALTSWLLLSTVGSVVAHACQIPRAIAAVDVLTLPAIRRLAERAAAVSVVASSITGPAPALASEPPPIPVVVVVEETGTTTTAPTSRPPIDAPPPVDAPEFDPVAVISGGDTHPMYSTPLPHADIEPITYVVKPGDNMWTITRAHLATQLGRPPTNAEIGNVWREVIALNEPTIRSGDADLIFPGESLLLPSV